MRTLTSFFFLLTGLVLSWPDALLAEGPAPPAVDIRNEEWRFDIFTDNQKVGHMYLRAMVVRDIVILKTEFAAPFKGQDAGFDTEITYRGTDKPVPVRGKATTRLGGFKLMDGSVTFTVMGAGEAETLMAKTEVLGYADKDRKPFAQAMPANREAAAPNGLVLSYPAFLFFAPRLLPKPGQVDKVVYMGLPADIDFPDFLNFQTGCVLSRGMLTDDGRSEFALKRIYPGGNAVVVAALTIDRDGKIVESRMGRFTLRPESPEPPKTPGAKPVGGK